MPTHDRLLAASTHRERVAGRRLARRTGQSGESALREVMVVAAAPQALLALIESREALAAHTAARRRLRREQQAATRRARTDADKPDLAAWRAWFDGASHPNPGRLGIGAILQSPAGEVIELCRMAGHGDSNEAEFLALIAVLDAALAAGASELVVLGDSRIVIDAVADPGRPCAAAHLQALCATARALAARFAALRLQWIPRHRNGAADALSQRAIGMAGADAAAPPASTKIA